eukprot:TRINITY_DN7074_c0_g1_i1.p1 TRINITY_DN7074_c0_g1~~TRINITY_DN7074_c0_g1_i1.p1  ORF type:complete len:153 (-),score=13.02 TRINITY_DN7074_c0_g1_i1:2-460(-)
MRIVLVLVVSSLICYATARSDATQEFLSGIVTGLRITRKLDGLELLSVKNLNLEELDEAFRLLKSYLPEDREKGLALLNSVFERLAASAPEAVIDNAAFQEMLFQITSVLGTPKVFLLKDEFYFSVTRSSLFKEFEIIPHVLCVDTLSLIHI